MHARVTAEIQAAGALGYHTAWMAEHHFSNQYGIMPDVFTYMGYLAACTKRIRTRPHPPLFMAAGTDRSMAYAARHGFGLMLSTLPSAETLAKQIGFYRTHMKEAPAPLNQNPAFGKVDIAHFMSGATSGYLGNVSEKNRAATTILHGSPETR